MAQSNTHAQVAASAKKNGNKGIMANGGWGFASYNDLHNQSVKENKHVESFRIQRMLMSDPYISKAKMGAWRWIGVVTGTRTKPSSTPSNQGSGGGGTGGGDTAGDTGGGSNGAVDGGSGQVQRVYEGVTWTNGTDQVSVTMVVSQGCSLGVPGMVLYSSVWKNYCPHCGQTKLVAHGGSWVSPKGNKKWNTVVEGEITCTNCDADFCGVNGVDKHPRCNIKLTRISGPTKVGAPGKIIEAANIGSDSGGGGDGSGSEEGEHSKFLSGEEKFSELINRICDQTDTLFLCKKSHIHITDIPSLYASAEYLRRKKSDTDVRGILEGEDIKLWQLEDGSYTLNVDQYGFYNTVKIKYKDGVWTERYTDLVRIYGEMAPETYKHPELDKYQAMARAKAYLAAHLRDFGIIVSGKLLHDGRIDIGDIVTLENPMTLRDYINISEGRTAEFMYVKGIAVDWEGEQPIYNDIELGLGPPNPENPEVPEVSGGLGHVGNITDAVNQVAKLTKDIAYDASCGTDYDCIKRKKIGDCHGMSIFIKTELQNRGVTAEIRQYGTSYVSNHRSVLYKDEGGEWQRFPYRGNVKDEKFHDTDGVWKGSVVS